jgi:hypothetical protein
MITYHYTSFSNWEKIKKEGLVPYEIKNDELKNLFGGYPFGVWLWTKRLTGIAHAGSIIYQMAMRNDYKIVLLKVKIDKDLILRASDGRGISLSHDGYIEELRYHVQEPSVIYTEHIDQKDIELVEIYDIKERLK